jgi:cytochrome c
MPIMKSLRRLGVAAIGMSVAAAFAASVRGETRGEVVAKGHDLVQANCARCHAIGKDDASTHPEAPPFRVVVTRYPPDNLSEALAEGISSGHPDMPEFVFEPPEIEAIVAYLDTLVPQLPKPLPEK